MRDTPILPPHIEGTIEAIAQLHREHHQRATPTQLAVARMTSLVARPRFVGWVTIALVAWLSLNSALRLGGRWSPDPPPFPYLQTVLCVAGLYITVLILITQRRENELSQARDQLTLELAILNEQKSAKIVALLEEIRRDNPLLPNRADPEAEQLAVPADPQAVLEALRSSTEDPSQGLAPPAAEASESGGEVVVGAR